ncbi:group II intron reverse transcriptase/maturase [Ructibacterium gallinarum]|uniref:Group II intron reverse transcriptase/maturase n=1 Tax=Ructibacterium gallinarum TaxID=2779355 RepID=A0A9D5R9P0_9FIRM|nr:group II intron reverse transcriptase/maturase [Ructibacterium gallinarum]MBE5041275.1 group II intron reverse transcriptase/maturase [Ructibacterium gallinarum]
MATKERKLKKQKLRNNEYYGTQEIFDDLYAQSQSGHIFQDLLKVIESENNILLAYRNIKKNKGSKTRGTNATNIVDIGKMGNSEIVSYVRKRLADFKPHSVRRVEIEKYDGRKRPLGIPTIEDRLIQQCIKQVLEPICEAKFYKHSYGFRPNRSTHHAIARAMFLSNLADFHFVIDIDIKGFFDNVNHGKLLKQLWTLGIQDKNLLSILSKMLKAEIKGVGIPDKGVPQGGILSPLLSNVVLNELDWWISSQWETNPLKTRYMSRPYHKGNGTLKRVFIVRYADDFKLFCRKRSDAVRMFEATKMWLKERLGLEINEEKSHIVNLKKNYSEFLGFKMKLRPKSGKWVIKSHMTDKAFNKCKENIRNQIHKMGAEPNQWSVMNFNAAILGYQNYYNCATNVYIDFDRIAFDVRKTLLCRTKSHRSKSGLRSESFQKFYGEFTGKIFNVCGIALYPINGVKTVPPMCFPNGICNYTAEGRKKIHSMQKAINPQILQLLLQNPIRERSAELNDNRISLYVAQRGRCYITGEPLRFGEMEVHHIIPLHMQGTDKYENLTIIMSDVHKLVHAVDPEMIKKYLIKLQNVTINFQRLNKLRKKVGLCEINV